MFRKFICPVCGGNLIVLKAVTETYGVNKRTGAINKRVIGKSEESSWARCENSCGESIDLFEDDTVIPNDAFVASE